jgi:hypothetical protein
MKWDGYPNLRMRPPAAAEGRGRIQIRIRRAFTASGAEALNSSQIYDWTHVRRRQRDKTLPAGTYSRTTRRLRAMCEPVGRGTSRIRRHGSRAYVPGRSPDWLKMKNPDAPAVKREAEEDWGRER